ncbi:unnamed protein product, partial [Heterosigma akashiwo]
PSHRRPGRGAGEEPPGAAGPTAPTDPFSSAECKAKQLVVFFHHCCISNPQGELLFSFLSLLFWGIGVNRSPSTRKSAAAKKKVQQQADALMMAEKCMLSWYWRLG